MMVGVIVYMTDLAGQRVDAVIIFFAAWGVEFDLILPNAAALVQICLNEGDLIALKSGVC